MEQFTMSTYLSKEDLYKAKSEYYMQQLRDLQDVIEAIDPFDSSFEVDNAYEPEYGVCLCRCWHCDMEGNYSAEVKHTIDCPVTILRKVLKSQGVSDETNT